MKCDICHHTDSDVKDFNIRAKILFGYSQTSSSTTWDRTDTSQYAKQWNSTDNPNIYFECNPIIPNNPSIVLNSFTHGDRIFFIIDDRMEFQVSYNTDLCAFIAKNEALRLEVYSEAEESLLDEIKEHIDFIWDAYVKSDEPMTEDAIELKQLYSKHFEAKLGS
jgi:hypothetical protein